MKVYDWLGKVNFSYRRTHTLVLMTMHIYLVQGTGNTDVLHPENWLNDLKWLPVNEGIEKIAYEDIGKLILIGIKKSEMQDYSRLYRDFARERLGVEFKTSIS